MLSQWHEQAPRPEVSSWLFGQADGSLTPILAFIHFKQAFVLTV